MLGLKSQMTLKNLLLLFKSSFPEESKGNVKTYLAGLL